MAGQNSWGDQLRIFRLAAGYGSQGAYADSVSALVASLSPQDYQALQSTFESYDNPFDLSQTTMSRWETGARKPPRERSRHLCLIWALARLDGIQSPAEADAWLSMADLKPLTRAEQVQIWPHMFRRDDFGTADENETSSPKIREWGEAPLVGLFLGRETEQAQLEQWLTVDRCNVVGIWGIGGQGKTTLATKVCHQVADQFDGFIWRSLLNAPPLDEIIASWIQLLSDRQLFELPQSLNERLLLLFDLVRTQRYLLVLDNVESILDADDALGRFRPGYEAYGQLFLRFGELSHQSCLLLTSREEPREFTRLRSTTDPLAERAIKTLRLGGLDTMSGEALLAAEMGQGGSSASISGLHERYSGNPLALILVSSTIAELYDGDADLFFAQEITMFDDVQELLAQHIDRLTELERSILYWLAIEREPVSAQALRENLVLPMAQSRLMASLRSLQRRTLIEIRKDAVDFIPRFTLQNVVMEYLTGRIVHEGVQAFNGAPFNGADDLQNFLHHHALMKATSKSYIRQSQARLIMEPIAKNLQATLGRGAIRKSVEARLDLLRIEGLSVGYTAGNILNILLALRADLQGLDFSHLPVWQACMEAQEIQRVNFAHADLSKAIIYESFGRVLSLVFNPNGQMLYVGTTNGQLAVFNVANLRPLAKAPGPLLHIRSVAISEDARTLVSSGDDGRVHIWDICTDEAESNISQEAGALPLEGAARYLQRRDSFEEIDRVRAMAICIDDRFIATGVMNDILLRDLQTQKLATTLVRHKGPIFGLAYSPSGCMLVSAGGDKRICFWQLDSIDSVTEGETKPLTVLEHPSKILSIAISPDGRWVAVGGIDGAICLWSVEEICQPESALTTDERRPFLTYTDHTSRVNSISFSPDSQMLASGSADKTVRLWHVPSGRTRHLLYGHRNEVTGVAFSPDGAIVASGSNDRTLRLWEVDSGRELQVLGSYVDGSMSEIAIRPDGQMLISGSDDGTVRAWNLSTHQCEFVLREQTNYIFSVAYSPDSQTFASASLDQTICIWDADTGRLLHRLSDHKSEVAAIAYHPTLSILASGSSDQTLRLWDTQTGALLHTWPSIGGSIWGLAFSPDGESIVMGCSSGSIYIWGMESREVIKELTHHQDVIWTVAVSPDGNLVASAGLEGKICLWDVESGETIHTELHHGGWVRSLAFSPDSRQLLSTGDNQEVALWDVESGEERYRRPGREAVAFHPEGQYFFAGADRWLINLRDVTSGECVGQLEAEGPLHGTNITGVQGISPAQKETLQLMGAIEDHAIKLSPDLL